MNTNNPFFEKEKPKKKRGNWIVRILELLVVVVSLFIISYMTILYPSEVDGPSMQPNFYTHQLYFANRLVQYMDGTTFGKALGFEYKYGDVVVLQLPGHIPYIKRLIGMPGDKISIKQGYFYRNGRKLIEEYLPPALYTDGGDLVREGADPIIIPDNSYFVAGDNRPQSNDSRFTDVGIIKKEWLKGRVFLRFWPTSVFGIIPTGVQYLQ